MIYKGFHISYVNEMKNNFWLKILEKYYIVVGVIADETDLQMFHIASIGYYGLKKDDIIRNEVIEWEIR